MLTLLQIEYISILLYGFLVVAAAVGMIVLSFFLGEKHNQRATSEAYESGIHAQGDAKLRFPPRFYLIAVFFVIFDLDVAFLFAWAISVREAGWPAFIGVAIFVLILLLVLLYEWRTNALSYALSGKSVLKKMHRKKE
jgi:NADH-quinone oxidoreductase subunit A